MIRDSGFGIRTPGAQLAWLGSISLCAFAAVVALRYAVSHDFEMLRMDLLQFTVMAVTFPWLLFIGGRVKQLQRGLSDVGIDASVIANCSV